ncbi:autotransporter beta-domain-containing protein [Campylobacter jejuni subsp. doylei]|uniref:Autotransporter beta-domain-containing protein n=1 Tax=Campylobacter jejuni subsp. doylei TaxID=32021 RepID=A0A3S4SE02_CAMJU|nr:autotransporter beta-domain-containing protein [Campylobacter jejuni subsp. doylei]
MKNTSLVKTLGGGVKEYSFNSKKIVLSLATISFLASYANASTGTGTSGTCPPTTSTSTRSDSSSTNGSTYNCTINSLYNSGNQGITLSSYQTSNVTIGSSGTLGNGSDNSITLKAKGSDTRTLEKLINHGTIKGKIGIENHKNNGGLNGTITVGTFENKSNGTIDGDIYMGIWKGSGTMSIEKFSNEGTISGKSRNEKGVHFEAQGSAKVHIKTFHNKNTGTIESKDRQGVYFQGNVTINTFHNEGFITSEKGQGVRFEGNVNVKTFHNKQNGTIQNDRTQFSFVLKPSNSATLENFINEGTIKGDIGIASGDRGTITVKTFENKKTIDGYIYMPTGTLSNGTISIEKFSNEGTITSNDQNYPAVYFEGNNVHIKTFENTGFISGSGNGLLHLIHQNFNVSGGVSMAGGTIETFKNSGTIQSTGTIHNPAGVKLNFVTVKTFENTGFISGTLGVLTTQGTIDNFINKGTIESTGQSGGEAAIKIRTANNSVSAITHFTNEGTIKSASDGVLIESGNKIETLTNKGTIESKSNGISLFDHGINSKLDNAHLGKIILEKDSSIKAGKKGINIDNQTTARSIRVGGIEVKAGASVSGDEAGIYLGKGKEITAPITISGTVSGGNAGIVNEGRMAKGIINDGEAELVISNQGLVEENNDGNTVANNGSGSVRIKEWVVTTNEETGRLRTVHVGGKNTANVKVNSITVDQSNLNLEELNDITNIISGVSTNNIADSVKTNGGGEISLSFDPLSGRLSTDVQLNASIAGASFRSSLATASRRATFIDNVMANAMQSFSLGSDKAQKIALSEKGNLYADASDYIKNDSIMNDYIKNDLTQGSYNSNKEHALFILPYFSSQSVELSLNEESKGHTKGTIIGYSTLKDSGIYGVYAGYEDKKMDSTYFGINDISYYTGLKYFNTLFTTAKGQEVYIKAQVQGALIKNDFTKKIGKNEAKAKAHSYTYGINTAWGMNFIADKNIFSPEAGFAYEGSYTEAFSMQDTRGKATVQGGERTYANHLNLFSTKTSFTWFRDWLPNLKTSVELGAKFNVNPKVKARARFGDKKVSNEFHLPRVRKFASTSLIVPVNEAFYFSLNYNGMFDEKGNTHTGFAQFNYLW